MKKKEYIKFGGLMLLSACLIAGNISGTYAKYTSEKTSSDTISIARWAFNVNDKNIAKENFTFNILDGKSTVAPGEKGTFTIHLENTSEVDAEYSVNFLVENNDSAPVYFCLDNEKFKPNLPSVSNVAIAAGESKDVVVYWEWETFSDEDDTAHGTKNEVETITVEATVTASQVIA